MIGQIFFNEVRASFNLRKPKSDKPTNIYLVCRIDKKQVKLSTGVRVYPDQWNTKKQEAYVSPRLTELDNINNAIVNDEINKLRTDFLEFKRYICDNPNEIDNSLFLLKKYIYKDKMVKQQELQKPVQWLRRTISQDKTIKSDGQRNTLAIYLGHLKVFEEFLKATDRDDITFTDLNLALIKDYETYLFNRQVGKGKTTKTSTVGNKVPPFNNCISLNLCPVQHCNTKTSLAFSSKPLSSKEYILFTSSSDKYISLSSPSLLLGFLY